MPNLRSLWSTSRRTSDPRSPADRNNKHNNSHFRTHAASNCHSQKGSSSYIYSSSRFTADRHNAPTPPISGTFENQPTSFPFMKLPAELRELVYYFAAQPIAPHDTGAIPGAPDRVRIPAIAQTSTQLRDEALHVLFKNRPAEVRMHSAYSFNRAIDWAVKSSGHSNSFGMITFCGRLEQAENQFYHVTLELSDESPHYQVQTRRCASTKADLIAAKIKEKLLHVLDEHVKEGHLKLSGDAIAGLILLIDEASRMHPPPIVA